MCWQELAEHLENWPGTAWGLPTVVRGLLGSFSSFAWDDLLYALLVTEQLPLYAPV